MTPQAISDPVSVIIQACHRGEDEAKRLYHLIAEKRQRHIVVDAETELMLNDQQLGEFAERYSSEVEPEYWVSRRLKH
jgi:hypothetical protein